MSESEALKALGAFPVVQAAVAILVILAGIWMVLRGNRDKKPDRPTETIPQFLLMGPVHDVMGAIHDMAEQSRQQTELLKRIETKTDESVKETHNNTAVLELIRNESRLR